MLSGKFENCYGLMDFNISMISYSNCNKAIIYAPNSVMKSSLAKVFEDIANGEASKDRIFENVKTSYSIKYHTNQYTYNSEDPTTLPSKTNCVYVVNSFDDKFEFTKDTVSALHQSIHYTNFESIHQPVSETRIQAFNRSLYN